MFVPVTLPGKNLSGVHRPICMTRGHGDAQAPDGRISPPVHSSPWLVQVKVSVLAVTNDAS